MFVEGENGEKSWEVKMIKMFRKDSSSSDRRKRKRINLRKLFLQARVDGGSFSSSRNCCCGFTLV